MSDLISINYDFDLFEKCADLTLHFATAGGFVPKEIFSNPKHNEIRTSLLSKPGIEFKYKLNPAINEILRLKFEAQGIDSETFNSEAYLRDFISYAKLGCFSFDRTYISEHYNNLYHLVAYPVFNDNNHFLFHNNGLIDRIVRDHFAVPRRIYY